MNNSNGSASLVPTARIRHIREGYLEMNVLYQTQTFLFKMKEVQNVKDLKMMIANTILRAPKEIVLLYGRKLLLDEEKDLIKAGILNNSNIIVIPTSDGGDCLRFTQLVLETMIKDLQYLKSSLQDLIDELQKAKLERFFTVKKEKVKDLKQQKSDLKDASEEGLMSILLWISNLLYKKLNKTFRENEDFSGWKVYLKNLLNGLNSMPYFRGKVFRGLKDFKDLKTYKKGETIIWTTLSGLSKNKSIAEKFSNAQGTLFEIEVYSSRDISILSGYQEEDVLMLPYSYFEVVDVIEAPGKPVHIKMREIPTPRASRVVLWIDDNPEGNHRIAKEIEENDMSCLFCVSTEDALKVIEKYRWLLYLENEDFKIITNMRRNENGVVNSYAGAELIEKLVRDYQYNFKVLIFCEDIAKAQEECNVRNWNGHFPITNNPKHVRQFLNLH